MEILQVVILGIIQGLTEFLPVSSTGHLVLAEKLFNLSPTKFGLSFDAALHMGTFLTLVVFFRKEIGEYVAAFRSSLKKLCVIASEAKQSMLLRRFAPRNDDIFNTQEKLTWIIIFSTIPAAVLGLLLEKNVETIFRDPALVAISLIVFCIPMIMAEIIGKKTLQMEKVTFIDGVIIGFAQAIALIPGVSRSGITISAGMFRNFDRASATRFAFLLSIPVVFGAGIIKLLETFYEVVSGELPISELAFFAVGIIFSFVFGYLAVKFLVNYLSKHGLWVFIWYRIALAILIIIFLQ